jgi:hypothetical protein
MGETQSKRDILCRTGLPPDHRSDFRSPPPARFRYLGDDQWVDRPRFIYDKICPNLTLAPYRKEIKKMLSANRIQRSRGTFVLSALAAAALLAACSLPPNPATPPAGTPAATDTPQATATQTVLDPCQLITAEEASSLSGASYPSGSGLEETISSQSRSCTYGAQTTNVFYIEVIQAPDEATADAGQAQFLADLQGYTQQFPGVQLNVTKLPDFADGGVLAQASATVMGETFSGIAIGFRKGTVFFGFSDEVRDKPAPTVDAAKAEATAVLGRLP